MSKYVDFHTHTQRSDGALSPAALIRLAAESGIGVMAITDHDELGPDLEAQVSAEKAGIRLIPGAEISCEHRLTSGKTVGLHVVVLNFRKEASALQEIVRRNRAHDRSAYVLAIIEKLRKLGIQLDYELIVEKNKNISHLGRMTLAQEMVEGGYVSSVEEAFDRYIGEHGAKLAYIPNPIHYVSLREVVEAALDDQALSILAHLFYYNSLSSTEQQELLYTFKRLAGPSAGLEVEYGRYSPSQRAILRECARCFDLVPSAGSDFHGQDLEETLSHGFPMEIFNGLMQAHYKAFG